MPRKVDVAQQKAAIAQAVWRLAARAGLEAVSLREVAAEAGVSMGRVQHYFRTKDAMLLYGLRLAQERIEARVAERLGGLPAPVGAEDVLRAVLEELLGEHPDTRQAIRVSVAYYGRAGEDPQVAELLFGDDPELHRHAATAVRVAQAAGRAAPDLDPVLEAHLMWSLATGLGTEVAFGHTPYARARDLLHYHLDRVLGPR